MRRRQRPDPTRDQRLRDAFWNAEDTPPPRAADTFEGRATMERASLSAQVLHLVREQMDRDQITQQELAGRMGLSEGRISQILSGNQNLTLKTVSSLAAALHVHVSVRFEPGEVVERSTVFA